MLKFSTNIKTWIDGLRNVSGVSRGLNNMAYGTFAFGNKAGMLTPDSVNSLKTAIGGLNAEQAALALSTRGLTTEQQKQVLVESGLLASSERMSAGLVAESLATSGLTKEKQNDLLISLGLMSEDTKEIISTNAVTEAKLRESLSEIGVTGAKQDGIVASILRTGQNGKEAISWDVLTGAIKRNIASMWVWLTTNPIGQITMGIGLLMGAVGIIDLFTTTIEENNKSIEKATANIEEYQKAIDELNTKEKEVTDTYKEYASLLSKSNAYGITSAEKEKLLSLSDKLVNTYGLEVEGVDALTGAYIVGTSAINDYVEALRAERLEKQKEQSEEREERIDSNTDNLSKYQKDLDVFRDAKEHYDEFQSIIDEYNESINQEGLTQSQKQGILQKFSTDMQNKAKGLGLDASVGSKIYQDVLGLTNIDQEIDKLTGKVNNTLNSVVKDILTNIKVDNADMLDQQGESLLTQLLTPYLTTVDWDKFDKEDFESKVESFVTEFSGTLSEISTKLQDSYSKMASGSLNFDGYEDMYTSLQGQAKLLKEMLDQGVIDESSYQTQISQIAQQTTNNIGLAMAEISSKFDETDTKSKEAFESVANNFIGLENQFKQGSITSTQYLDSLTTAINDMDFTKVFGDNKDAAQQFFTTLTSKVSNILQDTITQFDSGKISVTEYGDRLADFAKQQKALAKNAVEEAEALGIEGEELEQIKSKYEETENAIDGAIKKWEELRNVNKYLDENIETLNNATSTMSQGYQTFVSGLYQQFTQLSDNTKNSVLTNMQAMEGYANISADNLLSTMKSNVGATKALASAIAAETTGTLNNVVNNGGKVLSALGNAIKEFDFSITFDPNAKFSGGEFDLIKWAKSGGKEGIRLPSITWDIKGSRGSSLQNLGKSLSDFGASMSSYSSNVDLSDYGGGGSGGNGNGNGGGGSGGGGKGSGSGSDNKPDYEDPTDAIINRINLRADELAQQEEEIQNLIEIAELENDYKKQISLTNDLITTRKKRVDELNTANAGLYNEAEWLRNSNPWDEESWFDSQGNATEAYNADLNRKGITKEEQERIKDLFERLSKYKKAYMDNAEEIVGLNKEILQSEKDIADLDFTHSENYIEDRNFYDDWEKYGDNEVKAWKRVLDRFKTEYPNELDKIKEIEKNYFEAKKNQREGYIDDLKAAIDKEREAYEDLIDKQKESLDLEKQRLSSKSTLLQSYYNVINGIADEQTNIKKELRANLKLYEYTDEATRKLLFNEENYVELSSELNSILGEANRLQSEYKNAIANATLENIEEITNNYERQYELLLKQYEIKKAELEVEKKRQQLNNVLAEKNVQMVIGGKLTWVANTQDVINAQEELADAEAAAAQAIRDKTQTMALQEIQANEDRLTTIQNNLDKQLEEQLEEMNEKWDTLVESLEDPVKDIGTVLAEMAESDVPGLQNIIDDVASALSSLSKVESVKTVKTVSTTNGAGGKSLWQTYKDQGMPNWLNTAPKDGYASGTLNATKGWHEVEEEGKELLITKDGKFRNFSGGETVLTADQTDTFMKLINGDFKFPMPYGFPTDMFNGFAPIIPEFKTREIIKSEDHSVNFYGGVTVQECTDVNDFVRQITNGIKRN